ncbi:MAG: hypothetical protein R6X25_16640, partial [Candidatus Krumholzibacteriia bacterium]
MDFLGRRLLYPCCGLGFLVALMGFREQWQLAALPPDFPSARLTYPVYVEQYPAGDPDQLRFLCESWTPGERVLIVDAQGERHRPGLVRARSALPVTGVSGIIFMGFAVFFCAPRRRRPPA